ncbi:hypothetical protein [Rickettsia endosymbiont of Cantharis rufa]|uniref:hypothetical protein n=1 Tax=Rickettsia endosymbiont of Cantharis rufa TaxID=3066248 RepID=UPI0031333168
MKDISTENKCFPCMLVGYMRVSSENERQVFDLQYDALIKEEVDPRHIFKIRSEEQKIIEKDYKKLWHRKVKREVN